MRSHGKHYKIQFTSSLFRFCVDIKKTNEIRFIFEPNALFSKEVLADLMEIFLRPANEFFPFVIEEKWIFFHFALWNVFFCFPLVVYSSSF